jgi:hypothetical protein
VFVVESMKDMRREESQKGDQKTEVETKKMFFVASRAGMRGRAERERKGRSEKERGGKKDVCVVANRTNGHGTGGERERAHKKETRKRKLKATKKNDTRRGLERLMHELPRRHELSKKTV